MWTLKGVDTKPPGMSKQEALESTIAAFHAIRKGDPVQVWDHNENEWIDVNGDMMITHKTYRVKDD